jgi:hypothetical protein
MEVEVTRQRLSLQPFEGGVQLETRLETQVLGEYQDLRPSTRVVLQFTCKGRLVSLAFQSGREERFLHAWGLPLSERLLNEKSLTSLLRRSE